MILEEALFVILVAMIVLAALGLSGLALVLAKQDKKRLDVGSRFLESRQVPEGSGFLSILNDAEISALESQPLTWISKHLPDPRFRSISQAHARIYWRVAVDKLETSQMYAELLLVVTSVLLGLSASWLGTSIIAIVADGFKPDIAIAPPAATNVVLLLAAAFGVAKKVAAARRWQEAIDLYKNIGWPTQLSDRPEATGSAFLSCFRIRFRRG